MHDWLCYTTHAREGEPHHVNDRQLIVAALQRQGLADAQPGWQAEIVPGGLNSRVWLVRAPDGRPVWTVRMARPRLEWRLRHELVVLMQLAGTGSACVPRRPTIVGDPHVPGGELLVHAWSPGEPAPLAQVSDRARETLGMCLARLHAHSRRAFTIWPDIVGRPGSRRDAYGARLGALRRYNTYSGGISEEIDRRLAAVLQTLRRSPPAGQGWEAREFSLLHGDLSAGNVLWQGEAVRLIDWEYVRTGDPAEDLAYLTTEQVLDTTSWNDLARGYISAGGDLRTLERVPRYRPLVALDAALWWADYLFSRRLPAATRPEVLHRLVLAETFVADW
ncbi:MAG: hypothetical protein DCC58_02265 [Chloroflexi bacterium]|nr:MAG: hypothetical protein DCC58_02265 [Chloroflexota bacterium]